MDSVMKKLIGGMHPQNFGARTALVYKQSIVY